MWALKSRSFARKIDEYTNKQPCGPLNQSALSLQVGRTTASLGLLCCWLRAVSQSFKSLDLHTFLLLRLFIDVVEICIKIKHESSWVCLCCLFSYGFSFILTIKCFLNHTNKACLPSRAASCREEGPHWWLHGRVSYCMCQENSFRHSMFNY